VYLCAYMKSKINNRILFKVQRAFATDAKEAYNIHMAIDMYLNEIAIEKAQIKDDEQ
jgi:hypothetical protein